MLTSIKLFVRTLRRNKLFAVINILGLTIGFYASILIYSYVENEMSYDKFHKKGEQIYRVNQTFIWGDDNPNLFSSTGPGVAYAINEEIPEVEQVVRVHTAQMSPVRFKDGNEEKFFQDEYVLAVDTNFLDVFTYPLLYGDVSTALDEPFSIVLSKETSIQFFGNENPVGRVIDLGGGERRASYKVTGVLDEVEGNTYIDGDIYISMGSIERVARSNWSWMWTTFETFIVLEPTANPDAIREKLNQLPKKHAVRTLEVMGYTYDEYIEAGKEWNLYLQPFTDIYLGSTNIYNRLSSVGNIQIVAALIGSAFFLVILSCINFINLTTAQFTSRAKDVALRKVLGGSRSSFNHRFFVESFMYSLLSGILGFVIAVYSVPIINRALSMEISLQLLDPAFLLFVLGIILLVSAIASLYPSVFFNAFKPVSALKGELKTGVKGVRLRNGMLVTQYVLSLLLIICTLTVFKQLNFFLNADIGFEKEDVFVIENAHWTSSIEEFANEIESLDGVMGTSVCDASPLSIYNGDHFQTDDPELGGVMLNYTQADEDYLPLTGIQLVLGRNFDKSHQTDVNAVLLNETAVYSMGWPLDESILNRKLDTWFGTSHIIGVVKDFNYWTLHGPVEPFALFHSGSKSSETNILTQVVVKTQAGKEGLDEEIKALWETFAPNRPFETVSLTQEFQSDYETENQFSKVLSFFAMLTIIIASLGLLGIVVFSIEQKLKEVGVRKVLGASMMSIVMLFSKTYLKLLIVAFAIASPIAYYFMEDWLSGFEYRIGFAPEVFGISLILLLVISIVISSYHSIKASLLNPAEVLKDE